MTENTASQPGGTEVEEQPQGGEQQQEATDSQTAAGDDPVTTEDSALTEPTAADSAAVGQELYDLLDLVLEEGTRARGMVRAEEIFNDQNMPTSLRAEAASLVAQGHFENGSNEQACDWVGRAIRLEPRNTTYTLRHDAWVCQ